MGGIPDLEYHGWGLQMMPDIESNHGCDEPDDFQEQSMPPIKETNCRVKDPPLETEVGRSGGYSFSNMLTSSFGDDPEVSPISVDGFMGREDVKIYC